MKDLTEKERQFCELFVNGTATYAGNAVKCYRDVFDDNSNTAGNKAQKLLNREDIKEYIESLEEVNIDEAKYMKKYLTRNLMQIIDEATSDVYMDRFGTRLSPAPLRSVAVSASKALMEMYPVKQAQKVDISAGEGGITFNVIVPDKNQTKPEE